jgi:hypothetical protein
MVCTEGSHGENTLTFHFVISRLSSSQHSSPAWTGICGELNGHFEKSNSRLEGNVIVSSNKDNEKVDTIRGTLYLFVGTSDQRGHFDFAFDGVSSEMDRDNISALIEKADDLRLNVKHHLQQLLLPWKQHWNQ